MFLDSSEFVGFSKVVGFYIKKVERQPRPLLLFISYADTECNTNSMKTCLLVFFPSLF